MWLKINNIRMLLLFIFLFLPGVLFRFFGLDFISNDMEGYYIPWYEIIASEGWSALSLYFSDYNPPYLYLIFIATLAKTYITKVWAIKFISFFFEILSAKCIYNIVKLKYPKGNLPLIGAAIFWTAPTFILNSAFWGQADAIYTYFILLTLFLLIKEKNVGGFISYAIALSIKAQSLTFAPFLLLFAIKKRLSWYYFAIIPSIYFLMMVPAMLAGRPVLEVMTIYLDQSSYYNYLSLNAPNLYNFISSSSYYYLLPFFMIMAVLLIILWIYISIKINFQFDINSIVFFALISVAIVPFFTPKMHDRFFYPADAISILVALLNSKLWLVAILYQFISSSVYSRYLFDSPEIIVQFGVITNTLTIAYLLWKQYQFSISQKNRMEPQEVSPRKDN